MLNSLPQKAKAAKSLYIFKEEIGMKHRSRALTMIILNGGAGLQLLFSVCRWNSNASLENVDIIIVAQRRKS